MCRSYGCLSNRIMSIKYVLTTLLIVSMKLCAVMAQSCSYDSAYNGFCDDYCGFGTSFEIQSSGGDVTCSMICGIGESPVISQFCEGDLDVNGFAEEESGLTCLKYCNRACDDRDTGRTNCVLSLSNPIEYTFSNGETATLGTDSVFFTNCETGTYDEDCFCYIKINEDFCSNCVLTDLETDSLSFYYDCSNLLSGECATVNSFGVCTNGSDPAPVPVPVPRPVPVPIPVPIPVPVPVPVPFPTPSPILLPTAQQTSLPTSEPIPLPTDVPIPLPTNAPVPLPTILPSPNPTNSPTPLPTIQPSTISPTLQVVSAPTKSPTQNPSNRIPPTLLPSITPRNVNNETPTSTTSIANTSPSTSKGIDSFNMNGIMTLATMMVSGLLLILL